MTVRRISVDGMGLLLHRHALASVSIISSTVDSWAEPTGSLVTGQSTRGNEGTPAGVKIVTREVEASNFAIQIPGSFPSLKLLPTHRRDNMRQVAAC